MFQVTNNNNNNNMENGKNLKECEKRGKYQDLVELKKTHGTCK